MKSLVAGCLCLFMVACQVYYHKEPRPALSNGTSAEAKQEIKQAMIKLRGGKAPLLADNVFEDNDTLLIERRVSRDQQGLPITGSTTEMPVTFQLQLKGDVCGVYYPINDTFEPLTQLSCRIKKP
ncbi:hypothetical protein VTH8203_03681 [Vibrio thalassae]|uniref:Lipoprotein n=1 Tax=Vibrio thalassae TaxID=1243014 RepID=A0A240EP72_9VIBR|nr:hypothetical protein [Vibrio thalassae]SNX50033.1 hypothetical protein VTH8203_03681 [Vibrio thalassae]